MSCLDPLVKIDSSSDKLPAHSKRFSFDLNGRVILGAGFFKRPHRTLVVDSAVKVECSTEVRIPDKDSDSARMEAGYKASCPFSSEEAVAKALYHDKDEPKKVLDRIIQQCVMDYVNSVGEQHFFEQFYSHHSAALRVWLPGKVAGRATLLLENLDLRLKTEVEPNLGVHFDSEPFDLADNCLGVPMIVHIDFEVDTADPAARGKALQRASRLAAFDKTARENIKTFFRRVPLHRVHRHPEAVAEELKAVLAPMALTEGRVSNRVIVGLDSTADHVIPFDSKFECRLGDGTDLTVDGSGSLWVADVGRTVTRTDWKKPEELQQKLSVILQALVREKLAKFLYTDFRTKAKSTWEEIATAIQAEGTKFGVRVSLNWRSAWPFDWLVAGDHVSRIVECEVGQERVKCRLLAAMRVSLSDSSAVRMQPPGREDFLAAVGETIQLITAHVLQPSELKEYYAFEAQFSERLSKRISDELAKKFGLLVSDIEFQRKDNVAAENLVKFLQDAPILSIQHPTLHNITYEVHYRVVAYASNAGFPVYPKDIDAVSAAVTATVRQFLSDLPPQMFYPNKKIALQQLAKQRIQETMEMQHGIRIAILNWIPVNTAESSVPVQLIDLIHRLVIATDPMDQQDMRTQAFKMASLLRARGEPVPVDELEAVGVDTSTLPSAPDEERKAIGASGSE